MNLPNLLSLFRLLLVPVFPLAFFLAPEPSNRYLAAGVYVLAFLTDVADGYLARSRNQITRLGRVLDPLADKFMTFTVFVCITVAGIIPVWAVVILVAKELTMGLGALLMYRRTADVIPSNYLGKASTGVFFLSCAALVLFPGIPAKAATVIIALALALTVLALAVYIAQFISVAKTQEKGEKSGRSDSNSPE